MRDVTGLTNIITTIALISFDYIDKSFIFRSTILMYIQKRLLQSLPITKQATHQFF